MVLLSSLITACGPCSLQLAAGVTQAIVCNLGWRVQRRSATKDQQQSEQQAADQGSQHQAMQPLSQRQNVCRSK